MTSRLRSRWLFTALATPTPPTSSAVSPTRVRNCVKRSTLRSSAGEALVRVRISQPASGNCALAAATALRGVARAGLRQSQAIVPAHQAAGLHQAGRAQRRLADQQARAEADAAGELVGLGQERGANFDRGVADREPGAGLEVEPRQQRRIGGGAERAVALRQRVGKRHRRIEHDAAVERIGAVDRLDLDQRRRPSAVARHGAHGGGGRDLPVRSRKARSAASASRWISEKARSPPRMTRPSRARPSARLPANEPTPAIAMTPSAMQAMKT